MINVALIELNCKVVHLAEAWVGVRVVERAPAIGAIKIRECLQMCFEKSKSTNIYKFVLYCIWLMPVKDFQSKK